MVDIRNKWALITGASRGVGKEVAKAMAQKGCNLIVHSRNTSSTDALAAELSKSGITVHQLSAELEDVTQVRELGEKAQSLSGGLDILYNNAAIMTQYHTDIYGAKEDEFVQSFTINTIAPIILCNMIIPSMVKRGFGRVVNVTSGIQDQPQLMPYAASKAALNKYVYDMAVHLEGSGVLMNLLDPGWLRTDLGGPKAPNAVESVIPGALVPVLLDDTTCGKFFCAQDYAEN
ncbi:SDR family NAD(P)-dependent oxidoreductase [Chitinispirillales bacterium ANBcel5]|uniref:SDR family NAD(P)-dependent oxidoreductase n=1 Tax=Cellulosispirillum alkaliphilum TaxID=3039283 RepID=UPI002A540EEE|nr:SDR family NAD(P)-dependent oxidoreductase [Chitinispirillales bacterium ANBcel5]